MLKGIEDSLVSLFDFNKILITISLKTHQDFLKCEYNKDQDFVKTLQPCVVLLRHYKYI